MFFTQTCPLLLRVFTTNSGRHHRPDEFARGNVPSSELQIYTWWVLFDVIGNIFSYLNNIKKYCSHIWCICRILQVGWLLVVAIFRMDATLKELTSLVKEVYPEARKKGTHFSFNIVYPDPRGKMYRLVELNRIDTWKSPVVFQGGWYILICAVLTLQTERHRQYSVWQKRYRWLPDLAVTALPDWRLSGHRHYTTQQSPSP